MFSFPPGNSNGNQPQLVINPNSLLFHDTTRIRLNQSRPALHDSTFKLPNNANDGSPTASPKRGNTRLKQSSSFRSVSSVALRPREPPPPPPKFSLPPGKGSSLASVPARLQKALSTSTLLSKSTEKLNLSGSGKGSSQSHYGPGGRLLPSKSQISLPLGFTTTSKAAGLLASNSSNSVSSDTIYVPTKSHVTPPATNNLTNKSSSSSSLASRSKSLTDRCEALEKVLREQKRTEINEVDVYRPSHSQKLRPAPSLGSLVTTPLPKDDMDSKSIEIVTKENDVSEIRIYSASNSNPNHNTSGGSSDENLPYQGIIYESTKTLITTETPALSLPPTPTKSVPPPRPSPPEIHYAATDLFPSSQQSQSSPQVHAQSSPQKTSSPKSSPPPPVPTAKESSYECNGKSVVLIIDNNKKKSEPKEDNTPLANYNEPIDTIPRGSSRHKMPPPQIPLPSIPQTYQTGDSGDDLGEPLYDDVVNHSAPEPLPAVPKSLAGSLGRKSLKGVVISPPHQLGELPPLPPPPVPPHRTPIQTTSIISTSTPQIQPQLVSSTLPCLACPPSLPPPNLPSKSLSEFHNRPLVIQENEEESLLEEEVDNLYNDIGTPSSTLKSSTAAQFASAVKDAFFGAIGGGNKRNSGDFSDRRSVHSTGSGGSCSVSAPVAAPSKKLISSVVDQQKPQLIYDDTLSVSSSGAGSTASVSSSHSCGGGTTTSRIINHSQKKTVQQMVPLPAPPTLSNNKSSSELNNQDEDANEEPLYDDVLNLTEQTELSSKNKKEDISSSRRSLNTIVASEYHSSNSSDSGTEDLPPPLPAQGPPPLPKELPLMTFPLLTPSQQMPTPAVIPNSSSKSKDETLKSTRTLLTELNEKLSKLNVNSASTEGSANQPAQSSSTSPGGSSDASSGEFNSDSFHISKVVISPSSESSGVEEDYNSEKNYSLSLGGSSTNGSTSSRGGSDNENTYGSNKKKQNAATPTSNVNQSSGVKSENQKNITSQSITMARGKFLENMKLSMLGNGSSSPAPVNNGPKGLLMMSASSTVKPTTPLADSNEEEPIYEEIGENLQKGNQITPPTPTAIPTQPSTSTETVDDEDDDDGRSTSPIYADAFDAKSMFDGASRSEILSFLESIRDRLTGAESVSLLITKETFPSYNASHRKQKVYREMSL